MYKRNMYVCVVFQFQNGYNYPFIDMYVLDFEISTWKSFAHNMLFPGGSATTLERFCEDYM